jgi:hypothetical protein
MIVSRLWEYLEELQKKPPRNRRNPPDYGCWQRAGLMLKVPI